MGARCCSAVLDRDEIIPLWYFVGVQWLTLLLDVSCDFTLGGAKFTLFMISPCFYYWMVSFSLYL